MTIYSIENDVLRVTVSTLGAELQSVYHKPAAWEALWQGDPAYWNGRSPNLFPFVGRLYQKQYRYRGGSYTLPLHGFLPTAETVLCEQTADSLTFLLEDDGQRYAMYPFRFTLTVTYRLCGDSVSVCYRLRNNGDRAMPFGLGGHPGFRIPFADDTAFTDYYLAFDAPGTPRRVLFDDGVLCTGRTEPYPLASGRLPLHHDLFDHDAVVLQQAGHSVRIGTDKSRRYILVSYPDMPQVGFWHAQNTDAPYVCVEPWATLPGRAGEIMDFETSEDLLRLLPGERYENTFTVQIAF